jgi:hypothetical protein
LANATLHAGGRVFTSRAASKVADHPLSTPTPASRTTVKTAEVRIARPPFPKPDAIIDPEPGEFKI